jgi:hypothetical protein
LIKIKEENTDPAKKGIGKIEVRLENNEITTFDRYPIVINSIEMNYTHYEVQKKQNDLNNRGDEKYGLLDKAKEKALEVKDAVVDTTKEFSNEQKNE